MKYWLNLTTLPIPRKPLAKVPPASGWLVDGLGELERSNDAMRAEIIACDGLLYPIDDGRGRTGRANATPAPAADTSDARLYFA